MHLSIAKKSFLYLFLFTTFLSGCHGVAGNVIPQSGPSMENVYDSMGTPKNVHPSAAETKANNTAEPDLADIRQKKVAEHYSSARTHTDAMHPFQKLPNPELKLYVYPHFAGNDEIPIPGYYTPFNAYEKTHYALPSEIIR